MQRAYHYEDQGNGRVVTEVSSPINRSIFDSTNYCDHFICNGRYHYLKKSTVNEIFSKLPLLFQMTSTLTGGSYDDYTYFLEGSTTQAQEFLTNLVYLLTYHDTPETKSWLENYSHHRACAVEIREISASLSTIHQICSAFKMFLESDATEPEEQESPPHPPHSPCDLFSPVHPSPRDASPVATASGVLSPLAPLAIPSPSFAATPAFEAVSSPLALASNLPVAPPRGFRSQTEPDLMDSLPEPPVRLTRGVSLPEVPSHLPRPSLRRRILDRFRFLTSGSSPVPAPDPLPPHIEEGLNHLAAQTRLAAEETSRMVEHFEETNLLDDTITEEVRILLALNSTLCSHLRDVLRESTL
jgi:hypothetical protein